jgi:hypothetical protein
MAIVDYASLAQALDDYTGRANDATYVSNKPVFIQRAHLTLMRELRIPLLQVAVDFSITGETVALPADFRAVSRLFINADWNNPLQPTSIEGRVKWAVSNPNSRPQVFSIEGTNFAFGPIPDATYTGKLLYFRTLTLPASGADTNALLLKHPFAYLYGALAEYARFDKQDEDIALYEPLFGQEMAAIQVAEQLDAMGGGTLMPSPSGVTV